MNSALRNARSIAGYPVEGVLEHGSLGTRVSSRTRTGIPVAIEVTSVTAEEELFERALRRLQVMSEVQHQNLVPILDAGLDGEQLFMVTPLPDQVAIELGAVGAEAEAPLVAASRGLMHLHNNGVLHRDIQPCHIGWYGPTIRLGGVGLADSLGEQRTHGVGPIGAVSTMAPTLVNGASATIGSDVYSLGATLHLIATGHAVFEERTESIAKRVVRIATDTPQIHDSLPEKLLSTVRNMLSVDGLGTEARALLRDFAGKPIE